MAPQVRLRIGISIFVPGAGLFFEAGHLSVTTPVMNELSDVLADATRSIEAEYFHLSIDGGGPVYRERVYCYELYHQMRNHCLHCLMPH